MSYKIAVATSDGLNVDLHFGSAPSFEIYEVEGLDFQKVEKRDAPDLPEQKQFSSNAGCGTGCETGSNDGLRLLPFVMMFMATPIIYIKTKRRFFA